MAQKTGMSDRPVPRQPKTDSQREQITVQNRRREHLQRHPSYFKLVGHELADPVLYERLIKRHQSVAERQAEGKTKGYGRTLEADLIRGETKLSDLKSQAQEANSNEAIESSSTTRRDRMQGEETWDQQVSSKVHGLELWDDFLRERFIRGEDDEFDYASVDLNQDLDVLARADAEDKWFDGEEPSFHEESTAGDLQGQTGIQDF